MRQNVFLNKILSLQLKTNVKTFKIYDHNMLNLNNYMGF